MSETDIREAMNGQHPFTPDEMAEPKANRARGCVTVKVGGEHREVALTMEAMAYIREETEIETLSQLATFASDPPVHLMVPFIRGVLRGNGVTADDERLRDIPPMTALRFIHALINAAGDAADGDDSGNGQAVSL